MAEYEQDLLQEAERSRITIFDHPLARALGKTVVAVIAVLTLTSIPLKVEFHDPVNMVLDGMGAIPFAAAAIYALKRTVPIFQSR